MHDEIFSYVQELMERGNTEFCGVVKAPFRKRSEHMWRVYKWAERLIDSGEFENIDKDAVLVACLFHDAGYAMAENVENHAEHSAEIFSEYVNNSPREWKNAELIRYLIANHSKKEFLREDSPLELILVMEADLLDETGALSIVWDCMTEGAKPEQSFKKSYEHIKKYTERALSSNPLITETGRRFWREKQQLCSEFLRQLKQDLDI